ncbi:MAG TPA: hypothetical protein VFZ34_28660 [Blastocatellia bacterium]|nr:hypothetical protein [Blastocatellia bacterium]
MNRASVIIWVCLLLGASLPCVGQTIAVNPKGVNVNSQGATTVFLTFGNLRDYRPAEATWCGDLISAAPDQGLKCNPATIYGLLPSRYDRSRRSGNGAYTDIMSIPPSVARRAYQAAVNGEEARFFYVRRFVSTTGGPDQYVDVTCRLTGGGARVPFSLTDVKLLFGKEEAQVLFAEANKPLPPLRAEITYTGTGRLKGRWEVVLPGEELPDERDLLTEATLPFEERGLQKRYTQLSRFNVFLPPTGRYTLPGPDVSRLPRKVEGTYLILLRIEASDDREGDSNLAAVNAGPDIVHNGAVAGFPLPVLRYVIGGIGQSVNTTTTLQLLLPRDAAQLDARRPIDFTWAAVPQAMFYELEIQDAEGKNILFAWLRSGIRSYRAPSWLKEKAETIRWRVIAKDQAGKPLGESGFRTVRLLRVQ